MAIRIDDICKALSSSVQICGRLQVTRTLGRFSLIDNRAASFKALEFPHEKNIIRSALDTVDDAVLLYFTEFGLLTVNRGSDRCLIFTLAPIGSPELPVTDLIGLP